MEDDEAQIAVGEEAAESGASAAVMAGLVERLVVMGMAAAGKAAVVGVSVVHG
jgi:hypothetical protein